MAFLSSDMGNEFSLSRGTNGGLNRMEPVERRFASLRTLGRRGRETWSGIGSEGFFCGDVFGAGTSRFRFRSASSSSNSLINTSKFAIARLGVAGACDRTAGIVEL